MNNAESSRFHVLQAIEAGWNAFSKAPMTFVLFTLLSGAFGLIFQGLSYFAAIRSSTGSGLDPGTVPLLIISVIGSTIVSLWAVIGLIRGAWRALNGQKPSFQDFTRWDSKAVGRLLIHQQVLAILLAIVLLIAVAVGRGLVQIHQALAVIPGVAAGIVFLYLGVNQTFLPWIAAVQNGDVFDRIQSGIDYVDPSWWWILLLLIVEGVVLSIGLLLNGVGLLVASPLVICISTAAYRQLFGTADQTCFLSEN